MKDFFKGFIPFDLFWPIGHSLRYLHEAIRDADSDARERFHGAKLGLTWFYNRLMFVCGAAGTCVPALLVLAFGFVLAYFLLGLILLIVLKLLGG